ncbi:hypothetical protein TIFTF001_031425 [Ficus carica]|uniref:RIN4 pathogenic type III effector avirulence factor Avr cleavage site domain-containing protein n=1 Tax=Ficus carica TaxID=3494 RepID=A0AA88J554_FICCA|nr:hypothetical protein TIFTF001_031425 [Ficus carica]
MPGYNNPCIFNLHARINQGLLRCYEQEKGRPLPKFGEWDVNDPTSAEGFTVIFNKARDEKKTGGKPDSPGKVDSNIKPPADPAKPQSIQEFRSSGYVFTI